MCVVWPTCHRQSWDIEHWHGSSILLGAFGEALRSFFFVGQLVTGGEHYGDQNLEESSQISTQIESLFQPYVWRLRVGWATKLPMRNSHGATRTFRKRALSAQKVTDCRTVSKENLYCKGVREFNGLLADRVRRIVSILIKLCHFSTWPFLWAGAAKWSQTVPVFQLEGI
jgi:hypothetical protein